MRDLSNFLKQSSSEKARYECFSWTIKEENSKLPSIGFRSTNHTYDYEKARKKEDDLKLAYLIKIGDETTSLPMSLMGIGKAIDASAGIVDLPDDWDNLGAVQIKKQTWEAAASFLIKYSLYILDNFGVIIKAPEINPCPDGTIDLVWRTENARLLVNVKQEGNKNFASYYGDLYENKQPIKNVIENSTLIVHLAFWMKNLA